MNIIIFGGTGDLATRKLLPALFRHHKASRLPNKINIIGIGSRSLSNTEYLAEYSFTFAVLCLIHCLATKIGSLI